MPSEKISKGKKSPRPQAKRLTIHGSDEPGAPRVILTADPFKNGEFNAEADAKAVIDLFRSLDYRTYVALEKEFVRNAYEHRTLRSALEGLCSLP